MTKTLKKIAPKESKISITKNSPSTTQQVIDYETIKLERLERLKRKEKTEFFKQHKVIADKIGDIIKLEYSANARHYYLRSEHFNFFTKMVENFDNLQKLRLNGITIQRLLGIDRDDNILSEIILINADEILILLNNELTKNPNHSKENIIQDVINAMRNSYVQILKILQNLGITSEQECLNICKKYFSILSKMIFTEDMPVTNIEFLIQNKINIKELLDIAIDDRQFFNFTIQNPQEIAVLIKNNYSLKELHYLAKNHQNILNTILSRVSKVIGTNLVFDTKLRSDHLAALCIQNTDLAKRIIPYLDVFKALVKSGINSDELCALIPLNAQLFCFMIDNHKQIITLIESGKTLQEIIKTINEGVEKTINPLPKINVIKPKWYHIDTAELTPLFDESPVVTPPNDTFITTLLKSSSYSEQISKQQQDSQQWPRFFNI